MKKALSFLCAVMLLLCMAQAAFADGTLKYVDTPNGKSLNLRSEPNTGNNVIVNIPNFASVGVQLMLGVPRGWEYVTWNGYSGYVQTRYLSTTDPAKHKKTEPETGSETVEVDIKALFKSFKYLDEPLNAIAAPTGSFVNLRWAPTQEAAVIEKCLYGQELVVIAQNKTWMQVRDDENGVVGFMMRKFVKITEDDD